MQPVPVLIRSPTQKSKTEKNNNKEKGYLQVFRVDKKTVAVKILPTPFYDFVPSVLHCLSCLL